MDAQKELNNIFEELKQNYSKGHSQITINLMLSLIENHGATEKQIEKWGEIIVQNDRRKYEKSRLPQWEYIQDCFFIATRSEKEVEKDYTHHDHMLKYCETMSIKDILSLGKKFHEIYMDKLENPWTKHEYDFMSAGFSCHWQPLLTEVDNIDLVYGHEGIKNFKDHLKIVKNCILHKEQFEPFRDEKLRKKALEQSKIITEELIKRFPSERENKGGYEYN